MRSVTSGYRDILSITTKDYIIFQKVTSPKVGMNPRILSNHRYMAVFIPVMNATLMDLVKSSRSRNGVDTAPM